jgi:hypothetical protein
MVTEWNNPFPNPSLANSLPEIEGIAKTLTPNSNVTR